MATLDEVAGPAEPPEAPVIIRKSREEIARMARAGAVVAAAHEEVAARLRPGMSTLDLDRDRRGGHRAGTAPCRRSRATAASPPRSAPRSTTRSSTASRRTTWCSTRAACSRSTAARSSTGFHGDSAVTLIVGGEDAVAPEVAALVRRDPRRAVARARAGASTATASVTSAPPSRRWPTSTATGWSASTSATASAARCTRTPRCRTTARAGAGSKLTPGWVIAVEPMFNLGSEADRDARRRLDRGHRGRIAVGPLGAHHRDHRRRPGRAHRAVRTSPRTRHAGPHRA